VTASKELAEMTRGESLGDRICEIEATFDHRRLSIPVAEESRRLRVPVSTEQECVRRETSIDVSQVADAVAGIRE